MNKKDRNIRIKQYMAAEEECAANTNIQEILRKIREAKNIAKKNDDTDYLKFFQAEEKFYERNLEKALKYINDAIEEDNKNVLFFRSRGIILSNMPVPNYEDALKSFKEALKCGRDDARTWRNMAITLSKLNREQEALSTIDKALECNSKSYIDYKIKGIILSKLDRDEDAINEFDMALKYNERESELYRRKGVSLSKLGMEWSAIEMFNKTLEINADDFLAKGWLGDSLLKQKKYEEAEPYLKDVVDSGWKMEEFISDYAEILVKLDRFGQAKKIIERGLKEYPGNEKFRSLEYFITSNPDWIRQLNEQERLLEQERKRSEEFRKKMEASRNFSDRVIHKIGNLYFQISGIITQIDMHGVESFDQDKFNALKKTTGMLSGLIKELRDFSKPGAAEKEKVDVQKELEDLKLSLTPRVSSIEILDKRGRKNSIVLMTKSRFNEAVSELLENAVKVNKKKLNIKIYIEVKDTPSEFPVETDEVLLIKIIDDGTGVTKENKEKIFDPFFSTTNGTGLGLSIVKNIMQEHGGIVRETGKPREGACFELYFPLKK